MQFGCEQIFRGKNMDAQNSPNHGEQALPCYNRVILLQMFLNVNLVFVRIMKIKMKSRFLFIFSLHASMYAFTVHCFELRTMNNTLILNTLES